MITTQHINDDWMHLQVTLDLVSWVAWVGSQIWHGKMTVVVSKFELSGMT